ncbi:MAG: hypothetical protein WBC44_13255 [Planctomycetaceae bacterium]
MLKPSPPSQIFGCLFCILGFLLGAGIGPWLFGLHVASLQETDPTTYACGAGTAAALFGGAIFGGFVGTVIGTVIGVVTTPK